jgi:hypothetical protein
MSRRLLHRLHAGEQGNREGKDFQEFHEMSVLSECIERFPLLIESVRAAHWTLVVFLIASVCEN